MTTGIGPVVGNWYHRLDNDMDFEVIAFGEGEGLVEVQYFDGKHEALELADWLGLDLEVARELADWTGPVENPEAEEGGPESDREE